MATINRQPIYSGVDVLARAPSAYLGGKRFGLLSNHTGITRDYRSTIDVCARLEAGKLTALFACEHGIRGERQAGVLFEDETEPELGIPVYSLYGKFRAPTPEMLDTVDALVFDYQDLGVRFFTYLTTLIYTMQACAKAGKELIVLDRPNPLGGLSVQGGLLREGYQSMVGGWKIPILTGLTIGEFARLVNAESGMNCNLQVVPLEGWTRNMEFPQTGMPWTMLSPNMPTMDAARVYPGTCLFEGTNLSEGRGTTRPFEQIGAPWMDGRRVAEALNRRGLPGVIFYPAYFTPMFSKHQGAICGGVQLYVTEPEKFLQVRTGLYMLEQIQKMHPDDFAWLPPFKEGSKSFIELLTGSDVVLKTLHEPGAAERIADEWDKEAADWAKTRVPYLLYE
ncbi:exo-beta-N-acetylmuramidase NamZ family protein [Paenibacillus sp. GYB004]|uniref:exo-beta-N-acetylmuramidase NamZ family protein n=1 Tax=Paenibacillus sp. GYB004 TaxID=2994393 RepID=UPI002F9653C9